MRGTPGRRFFAKVDPCHPLGCWEWTAGRMATGYSRFSFGGSVLAHRVAYEWFVGPIPEGLEIDHLCRNRACVNPRHLEVVTHRVNQRRGASPFGINARKTTCPNGHPYDMVEPDGHRRCRACYLANQRVYDQTTRKKQSA